MNAALKCISFKRSFVNFLSKDWKNEKYSHIIGNKKIYITSENRCLSIENVNGSFTVNEEYDLYSDQEEADYRILGHLNDIPSPSNIVVRATDTDILAVLIGNHFKFEGKHIWMEVGNFTNNTLRFIDVTLLVENLGVELSKAIPTFHAFTGCDYSPAFVGKGKVRPFDLLVLDFECQNSFARLGTQDLDEDLINTIQTFVCHMYGKKRSKSIDDVLARNFVKSFNPKKNSESMLEAVKGSDGSSFPPCF